ncbi:PilZ domain-containing protein [Desulfosarcina sp.]|uniref:PilZ domain-containing protein n=1 Tax=Desulfosarcina sp. TaxID=2027861 RepID=UPI0039708854
MPFFKAKEDMGLEASLKLLDLPPDATIDDANQAYACLHRRIDRFHQDAGGKGLEDRQADMALLTCAYEKSVAHLSGHADPCLAVGTRQSTDLHFTINFSADVDKASALDGQASQCATQSQTVEDAVSITSRCLEKTELALPDAHQAVASAVASAAQASRRYAMTKQERINAVVAAKSYRTRSLLLEIEAKRAMDDAMALAERARNRVVAARRAAMEAGAEADKARKEVGRLGKSEEAAAAEVICAEDRLETAKTRLKTLTQTFLETRNRLALFQGARAEVDGLRTRSREHDYPGPVSGVGPGPSMALDKDESACRQQIMSELLAIEAALNARKQESIPVDCTRAVSAGAARGTAERRQHPRIVYPIDQRLVLSIEDRTISILDLSTTGMRLQPDAAAGGLRIVRGTVVFPGAAPLKVTGRVVRQDDQGLGLKLVTRIGNCILDQERLRLMA